LDPLANSIGLDGVILLAFILGLPANEIVLPIMIMTYLSAGTMIELDSLEALQKLLIMEGWTWGTALCTMLFSLLHFPCGTTLLTIRKETKSIKWLVLAVIITTATAVTVCFVMNQLIHLLGLL
jgi:ferrous iron transport protein B